jgi:1,4-alpha-glucan branching enzyme
MLYEERRRAKEAGDLEHAKPLGYFAFVLHSHIPYVLAHGRSPHGMDWLSESAAETYIPLLNTCHRLIEEGISPQFTIGITPVLAEQLAHPAFAVEFEGWLKEKIAAAEVNRTEFLREKKLGLAALADYWHRFFNKTLTDFRERYRSDIPGAFRDLQDAGHIEILTSAATHGYLPLLGTDEAVQAQVKQGICTYKRLFGRSPRGFWLPECAYRPRYRWNYPVDFEGKPKEPWLRKGVEEILAENGIEYFFIDSHLLRGGEAIGVYAERFRPLRELWEHFSTQYRPEETEKSPYSVYLVNSSGEPKAPVAVFTRDPRTGVQVWSADSGYPGDEYYLEFHKKLPPGGLRYWRISRPKNDLGRKQPYELAKAFERIQEHAKHFVDLAHEVLRGHVASTGQSGIITAMYDTELYGHWWFEGPEWLYWVRKGMEAHPEIHPITCGRYLHLHPPQTVVRLPEGSWGEGGYHWVWLNEWTEWTWRRIYPAEREMVRLARQYSDHPKVQTILKQIARELLLLQSSDWQFLISTWSARDYAELRAQWHADRFHMLVNLLERVARGEEPTPEEWGALGEAEERDNIFPDIEPKWWAQLEFPPNE